MKVDSAKQLPIIVLGGGPAGLTAAFDLSRQGRKTILIEKAPLVGGISSSRYWENFIVEYGPHTYHVKQDDIDDLVRENYDGELAIKKRVTNMLIRGKTYDYPLKFWQLFRGLNPFFSARIVADFLVSSIRFSLFPRPDDSFETWGLKRFGRSLYQLCFGQYSERVWGIPPSEISPRLASSKLHKLNLKDILIKLLGGRGQEQATYWDEFIYPEEGIGIIFNRMAERIALAGGEVRLETVPVGFHFRENRISAVTVRRGDGEETIPAGGVISTIPLSELGKLCRPRLSGPESAAAGDLKNRALVLVNIIIAADRISRAHWVYLLDPEFRFNRFCEQKNLLLENKPPGKTMLTFELCCGYGDKIWNASEEELRTMALEDIGRIGLLDGLEVEKSMVTRSKDAYPIYGLPFEENLKLTFRGLSGIPNLFSAGRQGLFLNSDMHDSMKSAREAARGLLEDRDPKDFYRENSPLFPSLPGS
ncbi:MAG: FAD-dependent oxidoreductase [Candidatus Erginobacter occultus]|nr:FAD-dependent oxidoreductase [Candidatus Erginobacter occultus]